MRLRGLDALNGERPFGCFRWSVGKDMLVSSLIIPSVAELLETCTFLHPRWRRRRKLRDVGIGVKFGVPFVGVVGGRAAWVGHGGVSHELAILVEGLRSQISD